MSALGGERTLAMRPDRFPQLHFGYIPLENAARPFLNGKPAHVCAAYAIAASIAVECENIELFATVGGPDCVAERHYRDRKNAPPLRHEF
jgi:hypothetical protein